MIKKMSLKNTLIPPNKTPTLQQLNNEFVNLLTQKRYLEAKNLLLNNLASFPNNTVLLNNIALSHLRLGEYQSAYDYYQLSFLLTNGINANTNLYDGLAECCHYLARYEESKRYAKLALCTKLAEVNLDRKDKFAQTTPPTFNKCKVLENIISFSLFGDNPKYCETAILNVYWASKLYPEWTCRFYVDETIPKNILVRLKHQGAQIIQVSNHIKSSMSGLFWRFLVIDDPMVKRFLIRDADSLVSFKERSAVSRWLKSDKWFHTMRDYYTHTELIHAGMWGGCHGPIKDIEQMIIEFLLHYNKGSKRVSDQHFLRYKIYPIVSQSVLMHDSQDIEDNADLMPSPNAKTPHERHPRFHIGRNIASRKITLTLSNQSHKNIQWSLLDRHNQLICQYIVPIKDREKISIYLPDIYIEKLKDKEYLIEADYFD